MQKLKKINITFIICFVIMITAPICFINKVNGKMSETENRYLASFPNVFNDTSGGIRKEFFTEFNQWLNDNIGFREFFVKVDANINSRFFNSTGNKDIIKGKNDWLYLMKDGDIKRIQNKNIINKKQIEEYKQNFGDITRYFNDKGTDFAVTVFPYKSEMYPENLPNTILKVNEKSLLDIMREEFQNQNKFDLRVVYDDLVELKKEKLIYSKATDSSHWNNYGAFIGYKSLMEQAKTYIPNIKILKESDFDIVPYQRDTFIGGNFVTTEKDYKFNPKYEKNAVSDKTFFKNIGYKSNDPWNSYNYFKNSNEKLPKAIVIGDSYVWMFMLEHMAESFSELVFIHQLDISNLNWIYSNFKPDIILGAGLNNTMLGITNYSIPQLDPSANIILHNTPTKIKRDKKYDINITVKNTSDEIWNEKRNIRLCIWQDGIDHGYRANLPEGVEVKPNEEYTFTLHDFQAPPNNNTYLEFQMLQEGISYFGEKERVNIAVR